ncbi:bifunctional 3-(3-hydroxy-phenyl)propionate/3-hydroxycinnamic acid hydroxylase [Variovorax sp. J22R133]|uniref:bifunctional 3-(3-hydroxy-phenyl)propionate/3-hydroxycinnamic acid hydroxylase n=1 Tax=Variovorax brevis TaxID=3053503 RepID=UPI00257692AC|nr:bifunctional 3-(3-hydroxy-phenyl)propionate/3-hydroxycinnamic acid hydroxylase [Variovorax sp. J22R133]MDM0111282.1 bifunctional 3-(3-hydroxy-phenyl)propionate/3-hydroxycinnamic acid hydroxylase [Variovorax sp. J22R133]
MASTEERDVEYDVAVVGFGPSGAVAAGLLAGMGLRVWVCDRSREVYDKPRAIAIDHEILRVFQQLGVVDAVAPYLEPFTPSEYFGVDGQLIKRLTMVAPPYPLGYTPSNVFTQPPVEAALRAHVQSMDNARIELGTEVTALAQDADGVTLQWQRDDGQGGSTRARFVVGCDGASSFVREQVGIALEDLSFDEPWLVVDVLANARGLAKLPATSVQYCEPDRPCTMVIGPGHHRRWEISLKPGEDPRKVVEPQETWKLLSRWLSPEDGELWRQASYRFHALVADTWRSGRVFVAGDAAHQQPPFLGQGMCQGVRDVANLAWKLAAVVHGDVKGAAAESLLDSYGIERKQHVTQLTSRIKVIGAVICERDEAKARERDARMLAECGGVVRDMPRQDVLPGLESGLLSPMPHAANGTIFPQPWIAQGSERVRFDSLAGNDWWLVLDEGFDAADVDATSIPRITTLRLGEGLRETEGVAAAWFQRHACRAAIVRPDRYVYGVASTPNDLDAQLRALAHRLGRAQHNPLITTETTT